MKQKRIALIDYPPDYPPDYFVGFGSALEQTGFEVYWVHKLRSNARRLVEAHGIPKHRVLDLTDGFRPNESNVRECRMALSGLERVGAPQIHDIILMDRILRKGSQTFALRYLHHLQKRLTTFLSDNRITLVVSSRDTALAMIAMLVSRALSIPWVVPTRIRIPQEMFAFCHGHETADMVRIREVTEDDRVWARKFLQAFNERPIKPAPNKSARDFAGVLRLLPEHGRVFWGALRASLLDRGNDYARYTIPRLIWMYLRRRANLLAYKLSPPHTQPGDLPYCLYALHAQPESMIDVAGSFYSDQIGLITLIARSLPVTHELYVKVHPLNVDGKPLSFYKEVAHIPGVRLINYDIDSRVLINGAAIVFAVTGTIAYEAALLGKNVVTFGNNYFNALPTIYRCDAPRNLPSLIMSVLAASRPADHNGGTAECLAELRAQCFEGEFNRAYGETTLALSPDDLKNLQATYDALHRVLVSRGSASPRPSDKANALGTF